MASTHPQIRKRALRLIVWAVIPAILWIYVGLSYKADSAFIADCEARGGQVFPERRFPAPYDRACFADRQIVGQR